MGEPGGLDVATRAELEPIICGVLEALGRSDEEVQVAVFRAVAKAYNVGWMKADKVASGVEDELRRRNIRLDARINILSDPV